MALSKRVRFEIFKRDSFTCQYCGNRPPEIVLEVDHIDPRSNGGSDDLINLITSCFDCNRGKHKSLLGEKAIRPDADLEFLACQQELAEAKRFLASKKELDKARLLLIDAIQDHWMQTLQMGDDGPHERVIIEWLNSYRPEEIVEAIDKFLPSLRRNPWNFRKFDASIKYVSAIMRNRRELTA